MERSRKMNNLMCQNVLDLISDSQKCINTINNFFRSFGYDIASPISVVDLLDYTDYGRGTLSTHLQTNEEFYKLLGLSRGVSKQYKITGKVALLVIAKYNDAFAAHIGYTSHADIEIQYRNQLEVQKNKQQLEKVMEQTTNMFDLSERLAKLESEIEIEKAELLTIEEELNETAIHLQYSISEQQSQLEYNLTQLEVLKIRKKQLNTKLDAIKVLRDN